MVVEKTCKDCKRYFRGNNTQIEMCALDDKFYVIGNRKICYLYQPTLWKRFKDYMSKFDIPFNKVIEVSIDE